MCIEQRSAGKKGTGGGHQQHGYGGKLKQQNTNCLINHMLNFIFEQDMGVAVAGPMAVKVGMVLKYYLFYCTVK